MQNKNREAMLDSEGQLQTEACSVDPHFINKLADLAANAEDFDLYRPVYRGRRKRVKVAGV